MSSIYFAQYVDRYFSKLDGAKDFRTSEAARAFDRGLAIKTIVELGEDEFAAAWKDGHSKLVAALRFAADEIEDAASNTIPYSAETP